MKILVLNGSPQGPLSGTIQYAHFIQNRFPEHELQIRHVCQEIAKIESDEATFGRILEDVRNADGVFWVFPVYSFLVPAHFRRFIELVSERKAADAFEGKYAAALTTSIHFFDHTAHNYIHAICDDWGMRYVGSFSAAVYDLVKKEERRRLALFAENLFASIKNQIPTTKIYEPVDYQGREYSPSPAETKIELGEKRMVILADIEDNDSNLARMVDRFRGCYSSPLEVVNLRSISIRAGCDGCFHCGDNAECIYQDSDDIYDLYMSKLTPADILVMAGSITDRYLSSRWKLFFDRGFFRPLIPLFPAKQLAFIISGPLKQIPNLRQILEAYTEVHQASLVGIVTDECDDSSQLDHLLVNLAGRLVAYAEQDYIKPRSFLGVGGMKIFRDEMWGMLRPAAQPGHRYYKKHGIYDFPQYDFKTKWFSRTAMLLTRLPGVRKRFFQSIRKDMIKPLQKAAKK